MFTISTLNEHVLAAKVGFPIAHPVRLFTLEMLGVDQARLIKDIAPTFDDLPMDAYDVERRQHAFIEKHGAIGLLTRAESDEYDRIRACRRRAIAQIVVTHCSLTEWSAKRVPVKPFRQNVDPNDYRSYPRTFVEMATFVTEHPEFQELLRGVSVMVQGVRPDAEKMLITVHQMMTVARLEQIADNAPEGVHQDGADFIVSALKIEERGAEGGMSTIYYQHPNGKRIKILQHNLAIGEGIFQADRDTPLWHDVSPVHVVKRAPYLYGTRSIIGFDIQIIR